MVGKQKANSESFAGKMCRERERERERERRQRTGHTASEAEMKFHLNNGLIVNRKLASSTFLGSGVR